MVEPALPKVLQTKLAAIAMNIVACHGWAINAPTGTK
jgi:hypothetical protein